MIHQPSLFETELKEMSIFNTSTESQLSSHSYGSFRTAIAVTSGVISVNGMFGKLLMILICCVKKMGSTQNSFLANLTVGNFMILAWCLPIWILSSNIFWPLGELACKHIYPLNHVITINTVFTMI